MPRGRRLRAESQPDATAPEPSRGAEVAEEMALLRELLPRLKPRDAVRLGALIACGGDRRAAAEQLKLTPEAYGRQLRQTSMPAARKANRRYRGARPGETS